MDNVNEFSRENLKQKLETFLQGKKKDDDVNPVEDIIDVDANDKPTIINSSNEKTGSCCSREVKKKLVMCVALSLICKISAFILFAGMPELAAVKASFAATAIIGGAGVIAGVTLIAIIIYSAVKCIQQRRRTYYEIVD